MPALSAKQRVAATDDGTPASPLGDVVARARALVQARRRSDPNPSDPLRGLHITDGEVDHAVEALGQTSDLAEIFDSRVRAAAALFELDDVDVSILLTVLAPDLDRRFEQLYAYLNDDVSRRRASIGLALDLAGQPVASPAARSRFDADAPLVRRRLVVVEDVDRPFLTRSLRVPDRVTSALLGAPGLDPKIDPLVVRVVSSSEHSRELIAALSAGFRFCYLREHSGASGRAAAVRALEREGFGALVIDLEGIAPAEVDEVLTVAVRDATLLGAGLVVGSFEPRMNAEPVGDPPVPVVLVGTSPWEPEGSSLVPFVAECSPAPATARLARWADALAGKEVACDIAEAVGAFLLTPEQTARAAVMARQHARVDGTPVVAQHLRAAARAQNAGRLGELASRYEPGPTFEDLVLPSRVGRQLKELVVRSERRDLVLDDWCMAGQRLRGRGVTALFTGTSGTGKTLSAHVVAGELGLDLYVIDLATVVDKYIGETEKNLERIFDAAEGVNGVLLFDEADALFGKRSDVSDAHDRHANIEVAYLLQRIEHFDGVAILTSNLRGNIDPAFTRRLDLIVEFPEPDEDERLRLWHLHLPPSLPVGDDLDLPWLAAHMRVAGGSIRNAALSAAFLAAGRGDLVSMRDLVLSCAGEYRKLGRLCTADEFGEWFETVVAAD